MTPDEMAAERRRIAHALCGRGMPCAEERDRIGYVRDDMPCEHRWVSRRTETPDAAPRVRVCEHCGRKASEVETAEVDAAIDVIARAVITDIVNFSAARVSEEWGTHPEIGDHDWARVVERVEAIADVRTDDYDKAYALLSARADQ